MKAHEYLCRKTDNLRLRKTMVLSLLGTGRLVADDYNSYRYRKMAHRTDVVEHVRRTLINNLTRGRTGL